MLKALFVSFTLAVFIFFALLSSTIAAPIGFTNQASFLSAIGGSADVTVDFNSFTSDTSFQDGTLDVGPFSLSSSGQFHNSLNKIDVSPFQFGGAVPPNSSPYAGLYLDSRGDTFTSVTLTFDSPINAFGADFGEIDPNTLISFATASGNGSINTVLASGLQGFFGFLLDAGEFITSFTFTTPVNDGFGMDNVLLSNANTGPISISEPSTIPIMLLALIGVFWVARRNKVNAMS